MMFNTTTALTTKLVGVKVLSNIKSEPLIFFSVHINSTFHQLSIYIITTCSFLSEINAACVAVSSKRASRLKATVAFNL